MNVLASAGAGAAVVLALAGCQQIMPLGPPPAEQVDIVVRVVATGRCELNLPAANNACQGVGRADGLACGRNGDTVRWTPGNLNTTVRSITFSEGNAQVCDGGVREEERDLVCTLKEQPAATPARGMAFKYAIGVSFRETDCDEQDPYVIVTRR